jgi:hypothetical protein
MAEAKGQVHARRTRANTRVHLSVVRHASTLLLQLLLHLLPLRLKVATYTQLGSLLCALLTRAAVATPATASSSAIAAVTSAGSTASLLQQHTVRLHHLARHCGGLGCDV